MPVGLLLAASLCFEKLRPRLKRLNPDFLMYTEPSGLLFWNAMDLTYNYDEQWLVNTIVEPGDKAVWTVRTAQELAAWLDERDAFVPEGLQIAHQIDSHDTFWWPLPGQKWRREQFGIRAASALLTTFMLCGGVYMNYVGGERGLERLIRRINWLRGNHAAFREGEVDYHAASVDCSDILVITRRAPTATAVVLVNLTPATHAVSVTISSRDAFGITLDQAQSQLGLAVRRPAGDDSFLVSPVTMNPYESRLLLFNRLGTEAVVAASIVLDDRYDSAPLLPSRLL